MEECDNSIFKIYVHKMYKQNIDTHLNGITLLFNMNGQQKDIVKQVFFSFEISLQYLK